MGHRGLKPDQAFAFLVDLVLESHRPTGNVLAIASNASTVMAILIKA